ncbi:MAG: NAD(P)-binding protein [Alphaproteobacteria bacterium]|nr:NAD(P)-binding protein [Rhodospirillales bacterium]MCW9045412.1 NAD(P)-binding protein [Alphaproteobacteria bacterium]
MTQQPPTPLWTNDTSEARMTGTWRSAMPNYKNLPSPCRGACPVGGRIAEWIREIELGDYKKAWTILADNNPFPSIAGRICHHPCETDCNRNQLDETVGICNLERFVGDLALKENWSFPAPTVSRDTSIAVVGGGPAGLSACYQLRRLGFKVSLYEYQKQLGGLLRYGIPAYRLEKKILDGEIQRIIDMGVDVHLNAEVGSAEALKELHEKHDAVYLATGASRSKNLPGLDYSQSWVMDSADFLAETNAEMACDLGKDLVVIGGGSAAMDVARTARRLGRNVTVLTLEPEDKLPAHEVEVVEAKEEEITFVSGAMMQSVEVNGEQITLKCIRVEFLQGEARGQFTINPIPGSEFELVTNGVIPSIGQDADLSRWQDLLNSEGPVISTDKQWQTSTPGIFAGGDVASMDRFVTQAIGMGKEAAFAIARQLAPVSNETSSPDDPMVPYSVINTSYHSTLRRHLAANSEVEARLQTFDEVQQPLSHDEAVAEASRCFSCGTCILCDNCYLYCPDMAIIKLEDGYEVKDDYCKGCGLCVAECPTGSIAMQEEK